MIYKNLNTDEITQLEFQAGKKATELIDGIKEDMKGKLDIELSAADNGKILQVGADGKVVPMAPASGLTIDDTLSVEGAAADAKAAGDAIAVADKDIALVPYAAKVTEIDLIPSAQAWFLRNGYIRHAGLSTPGQISTNASYRTYAFKARQDMQITGCDFPNVDSSHWGCVRVSNEEPASGVGNPWTGNLYDTITGNIPTSESPASVLKGQWVAVSYYRSGTAGDTWTLHLQETGAKILQPDIPLTPAMKAYVDAQIAELQALILENVTNG